MKAQRRHLKITFTKPHHIGNAFSDHSRTLMRNLTFAGIIEQAETVQPSAAQYMYLSDDHPLRSGHVFLVPAFFVLLQHVCSLLNAYALPFNNSQNTSNSVNEILVLPAVAID